MTTTVVETFGGVPNVRELPNGTVLVDDPARRRLLRFDATLATFTVVADSTTRGATYGGRIAGLVPYRGDSTLFVDPRSPSMTVIDAAGQVRRTMINPRPEDAAILAVMPSGRAGVDARGRLIYAVPPRFDVSSGTTRNSGVAPQRPVFPDSAPIVRVDLDTRTVDTVTFLKTARSPLRRTVDSTGRVTGMRSVIDPLPIVDDWAVLADGTLLVARGRDLRIDVFDRDGAALPSGIVAHEWQRLSDAEKRAIVDSTRDAADLAIAGAMAMRATAAGPPPRPVITVQVNGPDAARPIVARATPIGAPTRARTQPSSVDIVAIDEIPERRPAFAAGAMRADGDGRAWIRMGATTSGRSVYAVVDRRGLVVDRVTLPPNAFIAGFGRGSIYLATAGESGMHLARMSTR